MSYGLTSSVAIVFDFNCSNVQNNDSETVVGSRAPQTCGNTGQTELCGSCLQAAMQRQLRTDVGVDTVSTDGPQKWGVEIISAIDLFGFCYLCHPSPFPAMAGIEQAVGDVEAVFMFTVMLWIPFFSCKEDKRERSVQNLL